MRRAWCCALLGLLAGCATAPSGAPPESAQAAPSSGETASAEQLPEFTLDDPHGTQHASADLAKHGLVLLISAPTLDNADAQSDWADALLAERPEGTSVRFVLLQDMSVSWFEDTALERMREEDDPEAPPVLLIDVDGEVRRTLGVEEEATVVLVFDAQGKLVKRVAESASPERAQEIWAAVTSQS